MQPFYCIDHSAVFVFVGHQDSCFSEISRLCFTKLFCFQLVPDSFANLVPQAVPTSLFLFRLGYFILLRYIIAGCFFGNTPQHCHSNLRGMHTTAPFYNFGRQTTPYPAWQPPEATTICQQAQPFAIGCVSNIDPSHTLRMNRGRPFVLRISHLSLCQQAARYIGECGAVVNLPLAN